ncbi:hypothetical protein F4677DRAFT_17976 [Hypoxylon crocopeplum]|nr:hypothetical protein F4677DRAFT_17976 [Hypoxylon crocopeplum]
MICGHVKNLRRFISWAHGMPPINTTQLCPRPKTNKPQQKCTQLASQIYTYRRCTQVNTHLSGRFPQTHTSHTHMLPAEVPGSPRCAARGRLASQSIPSHRFDAGGFANSSSHQMWSVCSLQVSPFLHLSCRWCFLLSLPHFSRSQSCFLNRTDFSIFPFFVQVQVWPRSRRATDAMSSCTFVTHPNRATRNYPGTALGTFSFAPSVSQPVSHKRRSAAHIQSLDTP